MNARCIFNDPRQLAEHQRGRAWGFAGTYDLTVGRIYQIYGMALVENVFEFLVKDDWGAPLSVPAGLFEEFDAQVPDGWRFRLHEGIHKSGTSLWESPVIVSWGYPEWVIDDEHAPALFEREPTALRIFQDYVGRREDQRQQDCDSDGVL